MKLQVLLTLTVLPLVASAAAAQPPCTNIKPEDPQVSKVSDAKQITAILKTIAVSGQSLDERLAGLGIKVEQARFGKVTMEEVCSSNGRLKVGDVYYQFTTSAPGDSVTRQCPISSLFSLVKRGGKWLPHERTGNFLLNHQCAPPRVGSGTLR
ncbi:hypothetical protein [Chromobacterium haemolyticum]|uniref:hypothetical protein n=1 Tax=Chromobacterium haemolyticum TaxID=394935 RepID=UPI00174785B3|nr:hypothetical protein [Chromobacterium haemolyticum]QOD81642.1 hypothetical protein IEZ30_17285 [Chromobacterium haemolyticum]